jgi:hypothetical protein
VSIQILTTEPAANPHGLEALPTTILVCGLPVEFSQNQISVAIHRLIGTKNVMTVTFNKAQDDPLGHHDGLAQICCLNAAVYIHWCDRWTVPLLGKQVDFTPHARSLSGSSPLVAKAQAQSDNRPTRQIIADAIIALKNEAPSSLTMTELQHTIRDAEGRTTTPSSLIPHLPCNSHPIYLNFPINYIMIIYSSYYAAISKVIQVLSALYLSITPQIIKDEAVHTSILKQYNLDQNINYSTLASHPIS